MFVRAFGDAQAARDNLHFLSPKAVEAVMSEASILLLAAISYSVFAVLIYFEYTKSQKVT